jgi:hypothetical protein
MERNYKNELENLLATGRNLPDAEFDKLVDSFFKGKSESEKEKIVDSLIEVKLSKWEQIKDVSAEISVLEQLDGMEEFVNLASISRTYFGKTKSWIYQRLHGYPIHGKPAKFTDEEKRKLSDALLSISENIKAVAYKIA